MKMSPNNKPYLIYLNHENKQFQELMKNVIIEKLKNVNVKTFTSKSEMQLDENIFKADLIILNLVVNENSLNEFHEDVKKIYNNSIITPFLLITKRSSFDTNQISFVQNYSDLVFDFIDEDLFDLFIFINRIKVLLNIPRIFRVSDAESEHLRMNLWKLLDYSNFYSVILDKSLKIKAINYHLIKELGYDNEDELINLDWSTFLKATDIEIVKYVHEQITINNKNYNEFTNDIICKNKDIVSVKWFNTLINHNYNWSFSIGIPLTKKPSLDEDIESIRSYFKDILEQDKTTINAMREVAKKYSEKIIRKEKNECIS